MRAWTTAVLAATVLALSEGAEGASDLVIMSPHDEKITQEFTQAFSAAFRKAKGRDVSISWRDLGSGTETQVKFIVDQYANTPDGIGVDIFFGGGLDPFKTLKSKGLLETHRVATTDSIPAEFLGVPLYDKDYQWYGTVLSSFGILYNKAVLKRLGVDEPKTWEDMANVKLSGYVGLADPSRSGSARMIYETILQAYGWDKGMRVLTVMSANALDFYEGSSSLAKDVTLGEIAVGPAIDYYGRTQVAEGGADRLGFVTPASLTVITPDPIAILKGAPNLETAKMFVDFVMSEEGQRLWLVKVGSPGGPRKYNLMRMPILPSAYEKADRSLWTVDANPFGFKGSFSFDAEKATARRGVMLDLMKSAFIQPQSGLRACWKAVRAAGAPQALIDKMTSPLITDAECVALSGEKWEKQDLRAQKTTEWVRSALTKYSAVTAEAGAMPEPVTGRPRGSGRGFVLVALTAVIASAIVIIAVVLARRRRPVG